MEAEILHVGGRGVFRVAWQEVRCFKPWQSVAHPIMIGGKYFRSKLQCACGHFELVRQGRVKKHKLRTAVRAKGSLAFREHDGSWHLPGKDDAASWEKCPCHHRRPRGFPAILAVAKRRSCWLRGNLITYRPTEAAAFHTTINSSNFRSIKRPVQTLSSQRSAMGFPVYGQICS